MNSSYRLTCDLDLLAQEIHQTLKERHMSALFLDKSNFISKDSRCRIDTYQIWEITYTGYITINVYYFQPQLTVDDLEVKVVVISPKFRDTSMKMRNIQREIEGIILNHTSN